MPTRETTVKLSVQDNFSTQLRAFATALDQSEKSVQKSKKSFKLFEEANQQLTSGIKSGLTLAVASVPAVMAAAGVAALKMGMDMEQTRVAFTSLTGSTELANKHLQDLRDFAKSTPFQFTELTEASKKMQAFGFATKDVVPMMTDIGDAVSALGAGSQGIDSVVRALGQMQAKGKVSAEEMNQLTEVGINGWKYLAQGMNVSTAAAMKLSERGLIPAGDAIQYILKGMREDFGGGMAAQSKTAAGQLSNLADTITEIGTTIGELLLPVLKDAIKGFSDFLGVIRDGIKAGDIVINAQKKMGDAFKYTEEQIRKTATSYDEYIRNTLLTAEAAGILTSSQGFLIETGKATQEQIDYMTQSVGAMTEQEWAADRALQSRNATTQAYVKELGARMAADQAATAAMQESSKIMSPTELGMLALAEAARQGGDSTKVWTDFMKDQEKAAKDSAAALQEYHGYVLSNITAIDSMASSLMKATDQQVKQALVQSQIETLKQAYDDGRISAEELSAATNTLMVSSGLATEKSLLLASTQDAVNKAFFDGKIPLDQYIASTDLVKKATDDGKLSFDELTRLGLGPAGKGIESVNGYIQALKNSGIDPATGSIVEMTKKLNEIPKKIDVEVNIRTNGSIPGTTPTERVQERNNRANGSAYAIGGYTMGGGPMLVGERGPEMFQPIGAGKVVNNYNTFSMNIADGNGRRAANDFRMMQAWAGAQT